ncbi:hypothetical protein GDO81_009027 [Engystomops pustulosus]|uniref:Uncharacterized protein n=1 Tax=Engystomops pustulosus TaxID=76066 RepID=A0AAV7BP13_ENGPU|nr:hypothetical protein GDO81_009027 [Engystomops pustulosus]
MLLIPDLQGFTIWRGPLNAPQPCATFIGWTLNFHPLLGSDHRDWCRKLIEKTKQLCIGTFLWSDKVITFYNVRRNISAMPTSCMR